MWQDDGFVASDHLYLTKPAVRFDRSDEQVWAGAANRKVRCLCFRSHSFAGKVDMIIDWMTNMLG